MKSELPDWEAITSGVTWTLVIECTLFNIFSSSLGTRIMYVLMKFVDDTKLGGRVLPRWQKV